MLILLRIELNRTAVVFDPATVYVYVGYIANLLSTGYAVVEPSVAHAKLLRISSEYAIFFHHTTYE